MYYKCIERIVALNLVLRYVLKRNVARKEATKKRDSLYLFLL
jgi:alpha-D-ribose 1-methylphosphonate 5-triphosphate synthase subunit PhnL